MARLFFMSGFAQDTNFGNHHFVGITDPYRFEFRGNRQIEEGRKAAPFDFNGVLCVFKKQ